MADLKISQLPVFTSAVPATDAFAVVSGGTTKQITTNQILGSGGTATLASATVTGAATVGTTLGVTGVSTLASANLSGDLTVRTTGLILNTSGLGIGITPASFGVGYGTIQVSGSTGAGIKMGSPTNGSFIYSDNTFLNILTETNIPHRFFVNSIQQHRIEQLGVFSWFDGAGGTRMTLNSTGLNIANGNVILGTSGKGIDFTAAGNAAGMTSELLNDYEEGTWTGTLKGSTTDPTVALTATGQYTKIGRLVTIRISFAGSTVGASGAVSITGVPFASTNETPGSLMASNALTFTGIPVSYMTASSSTIELYQTTSANALTTVTHSAGVSRSIWVSLTYYV